MAQFKRNLAIVIGINNYHSGIPTLKTAKNDAEKIANILQIQHGYKIWGLINEQATLAGCLRLLEEFLPSKIKESDRLILYFAGHGIALNGDDGPEGFLIPQDACLGDTNTYLPMVRLQQALTKLPCRHFLTILDCCFAGAFRWSSTRKLLVVPQVIHRQHYDRFIEAPAWQVITSAAHDQTAFDSLALDLQDDRGITSNNHSPFAAALIEALEGKADSSPPAKNGNPPGDGVITATELYLYLRDRVEVATERNGARQTPGLYPLSKHERGEYIFLTPNHELDLPVAPPLDENQNPYRGLESFDQEHSHLFFGRQALTTKLYQFCKNRPLTVVLGASGSGKSSLVKAGLIPYIQHLEPSTEYRWQIMNPMRPGESAYKALSKTLTDQQSSGSSILALTNLEKKRILSGKLHYILKSDPQAKLLLVIDQAEELITLCQDQDEKDPFLNLLAEWLESYPRQLRIILTLRSDFEPQFRNLSLKSTWQAARFIVPAMNREELRDAIEKPAAFRVMCFEPYSLIDKLIDEVAQMPGALPLLSFALSELYLKYLQKFRAGDRDKRAITQKDYVEIGGVTQSLTQRADLEYAKLTKLDPAYGQTIRFVMLRMIALGGGELARRRVILSELEYPEPENTRVKKIIKSFSAARLIVEGQNAEMQPYVEPAHDALVRGWQKLLEWRQEEEESLLLQRRLTPVAEEWKTLELRQKRSGFQTKTEPLTNWLDIRLYGVENFFSMTKSQLLKVMRRMSEQKKLLLGKPEVFLWNNNPYLNVLQDKLNSKDYWLNQIEAEFVKRSLRRKRTVSRRSNFFLVLFLSLMGISIFGVIQLTRLVSELSQKNSEISQKEQELQRLSDIQQRSQQALSSSNLAKKNAEEALSSSNQNVQVTKDALASSTIAIDNLEEALATSNQALEESQKTLEAEREKLLELEQKNKSNNEAEPGTNDPDNSEDETDINPPEEEVEPGTNDPNNSGEETDINPPEEEVEPPANDPELLEGEETDLTPSEDEIEPEANDSNNSEENETNINPPEDEAVSDTTIQEDQEELGGLF